MNLSKAVCSILSSSSLGFLTIQNNTLWCSLFLNISSRLYFIFVNVVWNAPLFQRHILSLKKRLWKRSGTSSSHGARYKGCIKLTDYSFCTMVVYRSSWRSYRNYSSMNMWKHMDSSIFSKDTARWGATRTYSAHKSKSPSSRTRTICKSRLQPWTILISLSRI